MAQATAGIPPEVTAETKDFWEGASQGRLLVEHCESCGTDQFPPRSICRVCHSRDLTPLEVKGRGVVYSYTVNHHQWLPDLDVPNTIVLVEFADNPDFRVAGRLRGCAPEDAAIGMEVDIGFECGPTGVLIPSFHAVGSTTP